jgi:hypothetical protein
LKRFLVVALALSLVGLVAVAPAEAGKRHRDLFGFNTFRFENGDCSKDDLFAKVVDGAGIGGGQALKLNKDCPTSTQASVGAQFTGVKGKTVHALHLLFKEDDDCSEGSPRIVIADPEGDTWAFVCTDNPPFGDDPCSDFDGGPFILCVYDEDNAEPLNGTTQEFDFDQTVIQSMALVHDVGDQEVVVQEVRLNNCTQNFSDGFKCKVNP